MQTPCVSSMNFSTCLAMLLLLFTMSSQASESVATITAVLGDVQVIESASQQKKPAEKKMGLYKDDVVQTALKAKAKIILRDQTILSLGSESELVIDKFILGDQANKGSVGINLKRGLFKYLSGDIAKNKGVVQLKIPNGIITVRGTLALIKIAESGIVNIKTMTGELVLKDATGKFTQITAGFKITFDSNNSTVTSFESFADNCNL